SDLSPAHWQLNAYDINSKYQDSAGFVVLQRTATMASTASALSFIFENLRKPVIVSGSLIPLWQLRSDGLLILLTAMYLAAN
ncbi:L-asparaginase 1, partial [Pseudoalteromonas sp. S4488]|uniref:asparaginase domain-containing protein n=1 Tax=Pseudoalteromonas sp. S4488 TaxID=579558 RepID=UPI001281A35A